MKEIVRAAVALSLSLSVALPVSLCTQHKMGHWEEALAPLNPSRKMLGRKSEGCAFVCVASLSLSLPSPLLVSTHTIKRARNGQGMMVALVPAPSISLDLYTYITAYVSLDRNPITGACQ
eukprot:7906116-Pyramimonas_sp.AAC.1